MHEDGDGWRCSAVHLTNADGGLNEKSKILKIPRKEIFSFDFACNILPVFSWICFFPPGSLVFRGIHRSFAGLDGCWNQARHPRRGRKRQGSAKFSQQCFRNRMGWRRRISRHIGKITPASCINKVGPLVQSPLPRPRGYPICFPPTRSIRSCRRHPPPTGRTFILPTQSPRLLLCATEPDNHRQLRQIVADTPSLQCKRIIFSQDCCGQRQHPSPCRSGADRRRS